MDRFITKAFEYKAPSKQTEQARTKYNEARIASMDLEESYNCIAAASTDGNNDIYIWTHAIFVDRVAYYPFTYKYLGLDVYNIKMVYANSGSYYISPIYYE